MKGKSCTIVSAVDRDEVYVGSNLDAPNPDVKMWFIPSDSKQYGRVCFGFDYRIAENGMNEHGLFIDCNTVPETGWRPDPDKPDWEDWDGWYESGVPDGILSKCRTVDEALRVFESYNLHTLRTIKFFVADAEGQSAVLEWSKGELNVIRRPDEAYYQISTNFITSDYKQDEIPCYRYRIAENIFISQTAGPSVPLIRKILSITAMEINSPTQVSVIYELIRQRFYVHFYHNFEEVVEFNLGEELEKGSAKYELFRVFKHTPFAYDVYKKGSTL